MGGIISAFSGEFLATRKVAEVVIAPLTEEGIVDYDAFGGPRILQFWPEAISDNKSPNWQSKELPGLNLPLYQWINGGERPISFTAFFSRDMDGEIGVDLEEDKYNVDIDAAIAWLKLISSNDYVPIGDMEVAVPPPVIWIQFMGVQMGYQSPTLAPKNTGAGSGVHTLLMSVDTERMDFFPSGRPRFASVSLSFSETIQIGRGVYAYGRDEMRKIAAKYTRSMSVLT